jgi:hypothetical protein
MRSDLSFGEEERLSRVKAPVNVFETAVFPGDLDDSGEA